MPHSNFPQGEQAPAEIVERVARAFHKLRYPESAPDAWHMAGEKDRIAARRVARITATEYRAALAEAGYVIVPMAGDRGGGKDALALAGADHDRHRLPMEVYWAGAERIIQVLAEAGYVILPRELTEEMVERVEAAMTTYVEGSMSSGGNVIWMIHKNNECVFSCPNRLERDAKLRKMNARAAIEAALK